ncbi:beta-N-acetylhexosaminidase [Vibrio sp. SCSIO 43136]|uniref:beta-N-acetylhexosaminidase n=1 Tax=Vibrio sp. SCSIO 43136 TaxID=2819101 RepID=UPI002075C569|nr:beta-N-acetylhexosaminidase [Vibrio sp. SCSIO 43136]USD64828.1 beta-N-acetylhexosaminidase [Vibrio sp. SCSIO 43136]
MGPLWLDVDGCELDAEERELLEHPLVGGVILFARNYHDNEQLIALNQSIRKAAKRPILIGVDQEGGRVQRFKRGFSRIPAAAEFAKQTNGEQLAKQAGWLMAAELIAHDIDLSFAPVLDQGFDCKAIGSRAFGEDTQTIIHHSSAFMHGMKSVGMATTGKHFPGHGGIIADSHLETPYDDRSDIFEQDMAIFKAQLDAGLLDAMMPAHVIYPEFDSQPASGSAFWLKQILREKLGFKGIVFSDDLGMEGAKIMGSAAVRAQQSLDAGCDMILMCNHRPSAVEVLDTLEVTHVPKALGLLKTQSFSLNDLQRSTQWQDAVEAMIPLIDN